MRLVKKLARSRRFWVAWMALGLLLLGWVALNEFSLSALEEPGEIETLIATEGKHFLIGRSAREDVTPAPVTRPANPALGRGLFLAECSSCHGVDGRSPTEMGLRMYPRAADLGSAQVQRYSDKELFWVVRNGIRLTGMPGLGESQPAKNIWHLVRFIRRLPHTPGTPGEEQ